MQNENERPGFQSIGSRLPNSSNSPPVSNSTGSPLPNNSGITGSPSQAARGSNSTGTPPTGTGAAEKRSALPAKYSATDQPQGSQTVSQKRSASAANETKIAAEISRLLAHYWAGNEDERLRAATAGDWLEDLREFDAETVSEACRAWRRSEPKRPTIADIRKHCTSIRNEDRAYQRAARPPTPLEHQAEAARLQAQFEAEQNSRYREAYLSRQKFAEECGFPDFAAVMVFGIVRAAKRAATRATEQIPPRIEEMEG